MSYSLALKALGAWHVFSGMTVVCPHPMSSLNPKDHFREARRRTCEEHEMILSSR